MQNELSFPKYQLASTLQRIAAETPNAASTQLPSTAQRSPAGAPVRHPQVMPACAKHDASA